MYMSIGIFEDMYTIFFNVYIYVFFSKTIYHFMICMCIYLIYHVHLQAGYLHLKPLTGRQLINVCITGRCFSLDWLLPKIQSPLMS